MSRYAYRAFGLTVASDLELPEFAPAGAVEMPEVQIKLAPEHLGAWKAASEPGQFTGFGEGHLLHVPDVALYRVTGGSHIEIAPEDDADPGMVRLFTIGSAMGMALHQRGILVLHGATIAREGVDGLQARIIVGDTGAGKSTLAARLGQAGCAVLGDDTMALFEEPGSHRRWLWQGSQVFKLWQDSLDEMGLEADGLIRLGNRTDKFYLPNPGIIPDAETCIELAEILLLEEGDDAAPQVTPLEGLYALRGVSQNTYRPEYVPLLGREAEHFRQCAALAKNVPVSRLTRPWGNEHFDETLDLLFSRWDIRSPGRLAR